jgi:hypothetical protein
MNAKTATTPPADYPYAKWQDAGTFAVPPQLRDAYAAADPTEDARRRYWSRGYDEMTVTDGAPEHGEVVASPDGGVAVVKGVRDTHTRHLEGEAGYPEWLHLTRLNRAAQAARQAARKIKSSRCPVCSAVMHAPSSLASRGLGRNALACPRCVPLLVDALDRLAAQRRVLPDGRTLAEAVEQRAAALLDEAGR